MSLSKEIRLNLITTINKSLLYTNFDIALISRRILDELVLPIHNFRKILPLHNMTYIFGFLDGNVSAGKVVAVVIGKL